MSAIPSPDDLLLLGRLLAPGLAAAAAIGVVSSVWRSRAGDERRGLAVDLASAAALLVTGLVFHVATARNTPAVEGRLAFAADAVTLHLAAYLAAAGLTLALARLWRPRRTSRAELPARPD